LGLSEWKPSVAEKPALKAVWSMCCMIFVFFSWVIGVDDRTEERCVACSDL
jgi:hypothetical protein